MTTSLRSDIMRSKENRQGWSIRIKIIGISLVLQLITLSVLTSISINTFTEKQKDQLEMMIWI